MIEKVIIKLFLFQFFARFACKIVAISHINFNGMGGRIHCSKLCCFDSYFSASICSKSCKSHDPLLQRKICVDSSVVVHWLFGFSAMMFAISKFLTLS